mgnify:CR=1 FL=1
MTPIADAPRRFAALLLLSLCLGSNPGSAAPALPALGADLSELTVSGVSSGAYMAVQFEVAHSKLVTAPSKQPMQSPTAWIVHPSAQPSLEPCEGLLDRSS